MVVSGQLHALATVLSGKSLVPSRQGLRGGLDIVKSKNLLPLLGIELFFFLLLQLSSL
jgi:hypothetical protein